MENASRYLTILPSREKEIEAFVEKVTYEISEGLYDPLRMWVQLNAIKKAIGLIEDKIKDSAIREREKYGKESLLFQRISIDDLNRRNRNSVGICGTRA